MVRASLYHSVSIATGRLGKRTFVLAGTHRCNTIADHTYIPGRTLDGIGESIAAIRSDNATDHRCLPFTNAFTSNAFGHNATCIGHTICVVGRKRRIRASCKKKKRAKTQNQLGAKIQNDHLQLNAMTLLPGNP
jgi:hypothetical protein